MGCVCLRSPALNLPLYISSSIGVVVRVVLAPAVASLPCWQILCTPCCVLELCSEAVCRILQLDGTRSSELLMMSAMGALVFSGGYRRRLRGQIHSVIQRAYTSEMPSHQGKIMFEIYLDLGRLDRSRPLLSHSANMDCPDQVASMEIFNHRLRNPRYS